MNEYTQGFFLQLSLIFALGAQNIFVLEMGLRRNYHLMVAAICSICDVVLVLVGSLGVSKIIASVVELKIIVGIIGVFFLLYYGVLKLKHFLIFKRDTSRPIAQNSSRKKVAAMALSFTLLNPHVYIDTFFLIGGYASQFASVQSKILFAVGAGSFSTLWFFFLSSFSSKFSNLLTRESTARWISLLTGLTLVYLAYKLGLDIYEEIEVFLN